MGRAAYCLPCLVALTACTTPPAVPEIVQVPGPTRYVSVPDALTRPCVIAENPQKGDPSIDLLRAYEAARTALEDCNGRIEQIRALK